MLYLRIFNEEARTVELMELQLKHRVELLLAEERLCLEQHKKELAVGKSCVLYLRVSDGIFRVYRTHSMAEQVVAIPA